MSPAPKPGWGYWAIVAALTMWGVAYAWLVVFSFVIADEQHWARLIEQGRILPQYAEYIMSIPHWVIALTTVVATTRLAGAVSLILRRGWALGFYGISLACVLVIMFRGFVLADVASVIRVSQIWVEALFMVSSIFAVWFAHFMLRRGTLRK